jgi:hypothetical protein
MKWLPIDPMIDEDPYNDGPTDEQIEQQDRYECGRDSAEYREQLRDAGRG